MTLHLPGGSASAPCVRRIEAARFIREAGYAGCVQLNNGAVRVVLEPNLGGRVLSYSLDGVEALYRDSAFDGVVWDGNEHPSHPSGGRADIGPEFGGLPRNGLWLGRWKAEILGPLSARMTSAVSPESGVQLVREFVLAAESSALRFTQTIRNGGRSALRAFHWGRTFVPGGGIALAPLPKTGRFPCGYAVGGPPGIINFYPEKEPNIRIRHGILELIGPPSRPKIVLDVEPGWLAYAAPSGLLFVKRFAVYKDRPYGELAANNASLWYSGKENSPNWTGNGFPVEIEPIGPLEILEPGEEASFSEVWTSTRISCPPGGPIDLERVYEQLPQLDGKEPGSFSI